MDKWHGYFMLVARETARLSKDPSTQVGAVAVRDRRIVAVGFNGLPMGVHDDPLRYADRERKLLMTVHAEANVIADAARRGVTLENCSLYVTHPPCPHCCGLIIQAGVLTVYYPEADREFLLRWADAITVSNGMFREAGISTFELPAP